MPRKLLNGVHATSGVTLRVAGVAPDTTGNVVLSGVTAGPGVAIDDDGAPYLADGVWLPAPDVQQVAAATVDTANATTTAVNVAGLAIPAGLAPGGWDVRGVLLAVSAATTTGVQVALTTPAGITPAIRWTVPTTATASVTAIDRAGGTFAAATAHPFAAGAPVPIFLDGALVVAATTTSAVQVQVRSEIAASEVRVKAGSYLTFRRIA